MTKGSVLDKKTDGRGMNKGEGKKKISIARIENKAQRMVNFSKRKSGILKKVKQFQQVSGEDAAVVVFSPAGQLFTSGNGASFDAIIDRSMQAFDSASTSEDTRSDDSHDSAVLIELILNGMGMDDIECHDLETLVRKKTLLEKVKEEVDKCIA